MRVSFLIALLTLTMVYGAKPKTNATEMKEKLEQLYTWATKIDDLMSVVSSHTFRPDFTLDNIAKLYNRELSFARQVNSFRGRVGELIAQRLSPMVRVPLFNNIHPQAAEQVAKELEERGFTAGYDPLNKEMYVHVPTPAQASSNKKKDDAEEIKKDDEEE